MIKKKHFTSILNNIRRDHLRFESWAPGPYWSPGLEALPNGIKLQSIKVLNDDLN